MILRASFANITPESLAERVQVSGLSGSVFASLGAGNWGLEHGATVEFAFRPTAAMLDRHLEFTLATLRALNEQAVYLTVADKNGTRGYLQWADGRPYERLDA